MAHPNAISELHITAFSRYMRKWQRVLGLNDWRVERIRGRSTAMAEVEISLPDRLATYRLGKNFGDAKVTPEALDSAACHECIHVLLAEFKSICQSRAPDDDVMAAEHRVVNTLEKLLMKEPE